MQSNKISAIIVAAGMSSRMKAFKPLLKINEKTIIETLIHTLQLAGVKDILVVTGNRADELEAVLSVMGVSFLRNDNYAQTSMFDSAKLGFAKLRQYCEAAFFLPVDVPLFMPHSLKRMVYEMDQTGTAVVQPLYMGQRGHPLLIAEACFLHILGHDGTNGLRGALDTLRASVLEIELPDPGLVMDADTPEDYNRLCKYSTSLDIPSAELCYQIQKWFHIQECIMKHSMKVAEVSLEIASALVHAGYSLNIKLILAAALLHDIAKGQKEHAKTGGKWIKELGYPEVAGVVAAHTDLPGEAAEKLDERAVVFFADKLVKEDRVVSLGERFAASLEKFGKDEAVKQRILNRMKVAKRILERIGNITKITCIF